MTDRGSLSSMRASELRRHYQSETIVQGGRIQMPALITIQPAYAAFLLEVGWGTMHGTSSPFSTVCKAGPIGLFLTRLHVRSTLGQ